MAEVVIKQIEEGMTGRQVADLLYSNFLALAGAIGSGGGGDIPVADIEKGVTAYGWGDHRQAGYLKGITAGMVTGALGYTPMDEAAWTKANIKATLGIADWALAASKPTYKTSEVAEDGNLYFTDARAVAALAGVTAALAGDIGVLQGYFTNGVAKSAAKLATSRKLWGQSFDGTADVTGALTGVTDITASGTLTIGKIKIGDGVIEWDTANGGFKVTGGLWATDYLSSKGVNTGASGGGGGGSSYQRLDTWDGYTSAKDGWVLSAKLGYGLKTTQDDILRQLADISGQGTNVTFTPALTSGTQIGTLTIDGEPVKMYAPSIPTTDIEKGVTAYGWGNHASVGYLTSASSLAWGKITGTPNTLSGYGITDGVTAGAIDSADSILTWAQSNLSYIGSINIGVWYNIISVRHRNNHSDGVSYGMLLYSPLTGNGALKYRQQTSGNWQDERTILDNISFNDYTYSKSQIDTKLDGYLPLSGGTLSGQLTISAYNTDVLVLNSLIGDSTATGGTYIKINYNGIKVAEIGHGWGLGTYMMANGNTIRITDNGIGYVNNDTIIHSGNIGSQSVASAAKLVATERTKVLDANALTFTDFSVRFYSNLANNCSNIPTGIAGWANAILALPIHDSGTTAQLFITRENNLLYFRQSQTDAWKGIAFLDSNVASATKLQTARSIWGQSFDGTANITHGFRSMYTGSYNGEVAHSILNYYDNPYGLITRIYNDGVVSLQSQRETTNNEYFNLVLNPLGGNVGIGTTNPQYKLDVNGNFRATRLRTNNICLECGMDGSESGCSSEINNFNSALYMQFHSSLGISMCNGGGNVAVGMVSAQYKLDVNGVIHSNTGIFSDGYVSAKGQNTSSDMRLKRVLEEVTLSVDEIAAAPAFRFEWKGGAGVDVGTSAQYWEKLVPDAVKRDDAGWRMMQYGNVAMVALISLARRVKELEEKLGIKN